MSVQIHINGENALEVIREVSVLAQHLSLSGSAATVTATTAPEKSEKQTRTRGVAKLADSVKEPEHEDSDSSAKQDDGAEYGGESIPTDVELRALASKVGAMGPEAKTKIKALLDKYEVPNITAVPDEKRVAFKGELEALA